MFNGAIKLQLNVAVECAKLCWFSGIPGSLLGTETGYPDRFFVVVNFPVYSVIPFY
jgi:hypothetical protein